MGFFRKLAKNVKDKAALQDQSVSIERLPTDSKGIGSMLGGKKKQKGFMPLPVDLTPVAPRPAPVPTGIEALIRPQRTDPNNQQDMQRLMDMQKQTFRSFLAPPPVVQQPTAPYIPIDGGDLGLPMEPGTPAPGGVIFEPEVGNIDIQEILDSLPKGVGVGGIGSIPIPDIPYEIPQITAPGVLPIDTPFQLPPELEQQIAIPQLPIDLPLKLPQIENLAIPQLPIDLPLKLPQIENLAVPQLPIDLPLKLPQLETPITQNVQIPQSAIDTLGIAALNIQPSLPAVLETKPAPVLSMPAIQALNEVAIPKVAVDIPTYNYNDPARLARRDAYFASSRFD